jgi:IstB-like ATP binding N-terminal.
MLNNETMNKLRHMKLSGFIESLEQQENSADYREIDFNERFGLLVDCEFCKRQHNRLAALLQELNFKIPPPV